MSDQDELEKALSDLNLMSSMPSNLVRSVATQPVAVETKVSKTAPAEETKVVKVAPTKATVVDGLVGIPRHFDRLRVTMTRVLEYRTSDHGACAELWTINEGLMKINADSPTLFASSLKSIIEKHGDAILSQRLPADFMIDMGDGLELKVGQVFKTATENAAIREAELKQREIETKVERCPERKDAGELLFPETIMLHVYRIGLEVCSTDFKAKINQSIIPIYRKLKMPLPEEAKRIQETKSTGSTSVGSDFSMGEMAKIVTGIMSTAMNPEVKAAMDELRRTSGEASTPAEGMAMVQRLVTNPRIFQATIQGLAATGIIPAGAMEAKRR